MSSVRRLTAAAVAVALLLSACGGDSSDDADTTTTVGATNSTVASADLDDGVAAQVGSTDIETATVDDLHEAISSDPVWTEGLEPGQEEEFEPILRARLLNQLVITEIVASAAEGEFGIDVGDEDLDASRDRLIDEIGGEDAFRAELESSGYSEETFRALELPLMTILDLLEDEFGVATEPSADDENPDPDAEALDDWLNAQVESASVAIDADYGSWDPSTGQILPPEN